MNAQTSLSPYVGQPVHWQRAGWIAAVRDADGPRSFTLSGGMKENRYRLSILWDDGTHSEDVSEHIAAPWISAAIRYNVAPMAADGAETGLRHARDAQRARMEQQAAEREAYAAKVSAWRDEIREKIPADAKAVILAELEHDDSDCQTDYFNTKTSRCVILGFSRHTRDLFAEMRKAAARFEETAHLTDAPETAEHREKWSMGAGYYLKASRRYSDGWKVLKRTFYSRGNDIAESIPFGEWMVPEGAPYVTGESAAAKAPRKAEKATFSAEASDNLPAETVNGCTITPRIHDKKGFQMWIVQMPDRVERAEFDRLMSKARESRGWYSRKWGSSPAGFAFKDADAARAFAAEVSTNA